MEIDINKYKTSGEVNAVITVLKTLGQEIPNEIYSRLKFLQEKETQEAKERAAEVARRAQAAPAGDYIDSDQPIYDTLVEYGKFKPGPEKKKCIFDTVDLLLKDSEDAKQPGLLLGRIQCGKTDTFIKIMALAMDRGIDVCIVFTKGTNALADQTVSRLESEFEQFKWTESISNKPVVAVYDIMRIKETGIPTSDVNRQKIIIVCKKEDDNLKHLINLFTTKQPLLKEKKVLVVDDEADFASWNYMIRKGEVGLAVITRLIHQFIQLPTYCRYLQVTATPYSLYLQPDESIEIEDEGYVRPLRPRFTTLVPTHDAYVGGDHFFVKSTDNESMYSYLFHPISDKCLNVMKNKNMKYINNMLMSENIKDFRYAVFSYLIATIIRKIQEADKIDYRSSSLIHLEVSTQKHVWQYDLVYDLVSKIKEAYSNGQTEYFDVLFEEIYNDFADSNNAAREYDKFDTVPLFPSKKAVVAELTKSLKEIEPQDIIHVVNSEHGIKELLDARTGQLRLTGLFNIFIGGSILDRGITIERMLSFFYGRTPSKFQQDTVLQHMRLYGNRPKADMAVTRLHTTNGLYTILSKMNDLDNQLRDWLINTDNDPDLKATFVAMDDSGTILPCAKGKLIVSDTTSIQPNYRNAVYGFQTGPKSSIAKTITQIDNLLASQDGYVENEFFDIDAQVACDILKMIRTTYVYDDKPDGQWNNYGLDWKPEDMIGLIRYTTIGKEGKIKCMIRTNMNASRLRENGRFIDAPDTGSTDLVKAKEAAENVPALMLFRQNGLKSKGWRDTPFYWPVIVAPKKVNPAMYTCGSLKPRFNEIDVDLSVLLNGIDRKDVLILPYSSINILEAIEEGTVNIKKTSITENNVSRMLVHDITGRHVKINKEVVKNRSDIDAGIHSYNRGQFPFILHDYKYLVLRAVDRKPEYIVYMLCEIDTEKPYDVLPACDLDNDTLIQPHGAPEDVQYDNYVNWEVEYNIKFMRKQKYTALDK